MLSFVKKYLKPLKILYKNAVKTNTRENNKGKRLFFMGMSSSQYNLGFLTGRKHDIGNRLMQLSNEKVALGRDSQKITKEYQEALNKKILKWSNNSGVTYSDISYNNLMRPGEVNHYTPYMITDTNGRVVVDAKYQKYAEMISPNGKRNGNYSGDTRYQILSELTGISIEDIKASEDKSEIEAAQRAITALGEAPVLGGHSLLDTLGGIYTNVPVFEEYHTDKNHCLGSDNSAKSWGKIFDSIGSDQNYYLYLYWHDNESDSGNLSSLINSMAKAVETALADYTCTDLTSKIDEAKQKTYDQFKKYKWDEKFEDNADLHKAGNIASNYNTMCRAHDEDDWSSDDYSIAVSVTNLANVFLTYLLNDKPIVKDTATGTPGFSDTGLTTPAEQAVYDDWKARYNEANNVLLNAVSANEAILTSEEENKIKFYDTLFNSIAVNGWVENDNITNDEYLNLMLQNNQYMITTAKAYEETTFDVPSACECGCNSDGSITTTKWEFDSDIASNCENIFIVSDSDAREEALVDYEFKKKILNAKESRIDTRMKKLETEQEAINNMIKGIETVRNDNIERTFNIMS